jgi:hypothetical protein
MRCLQVLVYVLVWGYTYETWRGKGMAFDSAKDELNGKFHRIHLSTVALVFADPCRIELLGKR